jgi:hypothetical protein
VLAKEQSLNLFKNVFEVVSRLRKFAKLVALLIAPEKLALWEASLSNIVCANSNEIITFNA